MRVLESVVVAFRRTLPRPGRNGTCRRDRRGQSGDLSRQAPSWGNRFRDGSLDENWYGDKGQRPVKSWHQLLPLGTTFPGFSYPVAHPFPASERSRSMWLPRNRSTASSTTKSARPSSPARLAAARLPASPRTRERHPRLAQGGLSAYEQLLAEGHPEPRGIRAPSSRIHCPKRRYRNPRRPRSPRARVEHARSLSGAWRTRRGLDDRGRARSCRRRTRSVGLPGARPLPHGHLAALCGPAASPRPCACSATTIRRVTCRSKDLSALLGAARGAWQRRPDHDVNARSRRSTRDAQVLTTRHIAGAGLAQPWLLRRALRSRRPARTSCLAPVDEQVWTSPRHPALPARMALGTVMPSHQNPLASR